MNCLHCDKATNNPKFCNKSCAASYNNVKSPKRRPEGKCKLCGTPISTNITYCNKCWNKNKTEICGNNSPNFPKSPKSPKSPKYCLSCGKKVKNLFCDPICHIEHVFINRCEQVEKSGFFYSTTKFNTSTSFARKYIIRKYGNKCSICNLLNIWNGKNLNMILDHINGIPNDWSIHNLRLVCPNCDTQLSTFKSKNKGNGRPRTWTAPITQT